MLLHSFVEMPAPFVVHSPSFCDTLLSSIHSASLHRKLTDIQLHVLSIDEHQLHSIVDIKDVDDFIPVKGEGIAVEDVRYERGLDSTVILHAHRMVLSAAVPFFDVAFSHSLHDAPPGRENAATLEIHLSPRVSFAAFQSFIEFCYRGRISVDSWAGLLGIVELADEFGAEIILSSTLDTIVAQLTADTAVSTLRFLSQFDDSKVQASCFRCLIFIAAELKRQIHLNFKTSNSLDLVNKTFQSDILQLDIVNFMHILLRMSADQNIVHNFSVSSTSTSTDVDSSLHVASLPGNGQLVLSQSDFVHALSGSRVAVGSFISDVVNLDHTSCSNSDRDHEALFMLQVCIDWILASSDRIQLCDHIFSSIPMLYTEKSVGSFQLILQKYSAQQGFAEISRSLHSVGISKFQNDKSSSDHSKFQLDDPQLRRAPMLSHTVKSRHAPAFLTVVRDGAGFELCVQAIDNSVSFFRTDVWLRTVEGRVYLSDGSVLTSMHVLPSGNLFFGLHGGLISIAIVQSTSIESIPVFWRLESPHNAISPINDQQFVVAIGSQLMLFSQTARATWTCTFQVAESHEISALIFISTQQFLALSVDGRVVLWNAETLTPDKTFVRDSASCGHPLVACIDQSMTRLFLGYSDGAICEFDVLNPNRFQFVVHPGNSCQFRCLLFHNDTLYVCGGDLESVDSFVIKLFRPRGHLSSNLHSDSNIEIENELNVSTSSNPLTNTWVLDSVLRGHDKTVIALAVSCTGLVSMDVEGTMKIWQ